MASSPRSKGPVGYSVSFDPGPGIYRAALISNNLLYDDEDHFAGDQKPAFNVTLPPNDRLGSKTIHQLSV
jgi:hypothetical protein